jgi:hypothetical protein
VGSGEVNSNPPAMFRDVTGQPERVWKWHENLYHLQFSPTCRDRSRLCGKMPLRSIAKQFRISSSAVHRHKEHVAHSLAVATHAREVELGSSLLDDVKKLVDKAQTLFRKAEQTGDVRTALVGVREIARLLELRGRATGEFSPEAAPRQFRPIFNIEAGAQIAVTVNHRVTDDESPRDISPPAEPIASERGDEE